MLKISALCLALLASPVFAQVASAPSTNQTPATPAAIKPGARIYIEPMEGGFDTSLAAAFIKKKTPISVVDDKANADLILTATNAYHPAGWAKTIFISPAAHASASISIKDAKTGVMVFAYNVDKMNSARGNQSTAEACAKHLKSFIEKQGR